MNNRELRAARAVALKAAKALSDKGTRLSPSEQKRFDDHMGEAADLLTQITALENRGAPPSGQPDGGDRESSREVEHRAAFVNYLRLGPNKMPTEERDLLQKEYRDMGSGGQGAYPSATTGFFVPVGFVQNVISALKYFGPFLDKDVTEIMESTTGQVLPYPTDNDVNISGERVGENAQVSSSDVALGQILFGAYKYSSRLIKVSVELLADSAFDFEAFLTRKFAQRLGRILVSDFTNGLGSTFQQPMGLVTATLASGNVVQAVGSGANDGTSIAGLTIGSDDFVNLEHSVDVLYRPNGSFMANDSTWKSIRKIKDKFGRPIWQAALTAGQPDTINGFKMLTNNYMDALPVSPSSPPITRNTMVFGDFKNYIVRRVQGLSLLRLEERYADFGQVGFLAFARYDGMPAAAGTGPQFPFAILQHSL
jgi:HK97 family phage major capsid protein